MELIEQFIQKEGIELTEDQKIGALATYQDLIVTDIDIMTNEQILKVFVTRRDKKRESTRIRTVAECNSKCLFLKIRWYLRQYSLFRKEEVW